MDASGASVLPFAVRVAVKLLPCREHLECTSHLGHIFLSSAPYRQLQLNLGVIDGLEHAIFKHRIVIPMVKSCKQLTQ